VHVHVATLTKRPNGSIARRIVTVDAASLRFGRSPSNEILLGDIRVGLSEIEVERRSDGALVFKKTGTNPILINGAEAEPGTINIGDIVQIGPYEIIFVDPPEGFDTAITVEMKDPLGDDFRRLQENSRVGLDRAGLSKRAYSWAGFVTVLLLFLFFPIGAYYVNRADPVPGAMPSADRLQTSFVYTVNSTIRRIWNSGELVDTHKYFMNDCGTCHETPFALVKDETCLRCHRDIPKHFEESLGVRDIDETRCGTCHLDHRGSVGIVLRSEELCTNCHLDIRKTAPESKVADAGEFGNAHPPFRLTLLQDPVKGTTTRVAIDADPNEKLSHEQALKFPHEKHLNPQGWPRFMKTLVCADCHQLGTGRPDLSTMSFDKQCYECHLEALKFDTRYPERHVPHGSAENAQTYLEDFYARLALEGGVDEPSAPESVRRRPGTPLTEPERLEALAWAAKKAKDALPFVFDEKRGCGACHNVSVENGTQYRIQKVTVQKKFIPNARFDHWRHKVLNCIDCHGAVETSIDAHDVAMPTISQCRQCHAGAKAESRVPSTCISCHDFHRHNLGPLRPRTAALEERKG
jgi:hypothetical protein